MKEDLLQYVWQYQLFDKALLQLEDGRELCIQKVGQWNKESGPDFLQAQIKIGEINWFGSVEIHIQSSEWHNHKHHSDPAYKNVILHVVWHHNKVIFHQDGTPIPTLSIKNRISASMLQKYQVLVAKERVQDLRCTFALHHLSSLQKYSTLEKAAIKRLERKAKDVENLFLVQNKHWQKTALQWISKAYGFKVNAESFLTLGGKIDLKHILKEKHAFENITAYLFEVAGLSDHTYISEKLINTAKYLSTKYDIASFSMQRHEFRKSRMRPANFPEVRLIQLSAILFHQPNLMDLLVSNQDLKDIILEFENANSTIQEKNGDFKKAQRLGKESIYSIIINAIVPFRFAYGIYIGDENLKENALCLLQSLPAEKNRFTKIFEKHHFPIENALDSQGAIEQYQYGCNEKLCLHCPIGMSIMKNHDLVVN